MKHIFQSVVLAITLGFTALGSAAAEELVIRKINSDKVVSQFWKMRDLFKDIQVEDEKIKVESIAKQKEVEAQNAEILKLDKQLKDPKLPRGERQNLESQFKRKLDRLNSTKGLHQEYIQGKMKALKVQLESQRKILLTEVREIVLDYAAKNGIDAIYDEKQLVFMKDKYDISDEIIELINKDAPEEAKETAKEEAASEEKAPEEGGE